MKAIISKSQIQGTLTPPPSKSYTIRALVAAALSPGWSLIQNPLSSDDTEAAIGILTKVGVVIEKSVESWRVLGGEWHAPAGELFCAESAATLRFLLPLAAAKPGEYRFIMGPSLARRPIAPLVDALRLLGTSCCLESNSVTVTGGLVADNRVSISGDESSQYISGLLLAAPLMPQGLNIRLTSPPESRPYLRMTVQIMESFGIRVSSDDDLRQFAVAPQSYRPAVFAIEADWSSAAYFLGLGVLCGETTLNGMDTGSLQADRMIIKLLSGMGASIRNNENTVGVSRWPLESLNIDLSDAIDLLPTAACLAAMVPATSELRGIARARLKESNRIQAIRNNLGAMGIETQESTNSLIIEGGAPRGTELDSFGDHRIAMAFAMLGAATGDMTIHGAECVSKTYPAFWRDFVTVGGRVTIYG